MKKLAKRELQLGCGAALAASGVPPILLAGGFLRWSELTFAATEAVLVLIY
jgi:hypothetical protein